jgi:RNA polymerase sigma factor for flagellar operon FliA
MEELKVSVEQAEMPFPSSSVSATAAEFLEPQPPVSHAARLYADHARKQREDEMIVRYLPLVHKIVGKVVTYLQPPLSREDLVSAGTIGLVKAARDYDSTRDAEFQTYAYIRVRGAVIDELRSWSFAPPNIKRQFDQAREISSRMLEENGQLPDDAQLAEKMGITPEKMYRIFETARARHFLSIHEGAEDSPMLGRVLACSNTDEPDHEMEREEMLELLTKAIQQLSEKQRRIVVMYYQKELTMKQIAEVLEITESRVSQLHAAALFKLSVQLRQENE